MAPPIVRTACGLVRGTEAAGVHRFLGLPYAAPPVGPLRFGAPQRPEPWQGVRPADRPGPAAPQPVDQPPLIGEVAETGDDCLHVNVYTPDAGSAGLPVLVWIHGGGYVYGSNAGEVGQADALARRGLVVVTINYRLGVDGFLVLRDRPANRGVLDWKAALDWVQENISAFGGDPSRVTIGGQSAGAMACLTLLTDPASITRFGQVFAMSGPNATAATWDEASSMAEALTSRLGVEPTASGLAAVPYRDLFAAQTELAPVAGIRFGHPPLQLFDEVAGHRGWLGPVVDGDVVAEDPAPVVGGLVAGWRPLVVGTTAEETDALIRVPGADLGPEEVRRALVGVGLTAEGAQRWLDAEPERSPGAALGAALTAITFGVPAVRVAEARFESPAPTFLYEMSWRPPTVLGAVHAIDVPLIFDKYDDPVLAMVFGGESPAQIADDMATALARFVVEGDPGWPAYEPAGRSTMCFERPRSVVRPDPARTARSTFASVVRPYASAGSVPTRHP